MIINILKQYPEIHLKGYETGLHFLMEIDMGMSEEELVQTAFKNKISVTGLNEYIKNTQLKQHVPTLVIGYSGIPTEEVGKAINLLIESWGL